MSDETTAKLLERIASLEAKLSPSKGTEGKPIFDKRRFTLDPIGYLTEQGVDTQHIARHFVANVLGKDCPPQLSAMVQMGPQMVATSNLEEMVTNLGRQVNQLIEQSKQKDLVASLKTQTVDPVKYPTLAAAMKGNPSLLESEMKSLGDVADSSEALAKIEEKLSPYAKAFGYKPPATGSASPNSSETASITTTIDSDSPGFRPANELSGGEVPPLVQLAPGAWTDDDHRKLRDAVVKKHSALA